MPRAMLASCNPYEIELPLHLELNLPDGRGVLSLCSERRVGSVDVPFRLD